MIPGHPHSAAAAARRGFILFETMLAVLIFSVSVLALGRCVENCMKAELLKDEDARARRFLENRLAEIEAGAVPIDKELNEKLKDGFAGMTIHQSRVEVKRKNEKNQDIVGISRVTLDLSWPSRGEKQTRSLTFYVYPRPT